VTTTTRRLLAGLAWWLILIGIAIGCWRTWDIVTGTHTILGDMPFVIQQLLVTTWSVLGPVAQGAALLVILMVEKRLGGKVD